MLSLSVSSCSSVALARRPHTCCSLRPLTGIQVKAGSTPDGWCSESPAGAQPVLARSHSPVGIEVASVWVGGPGRLVGGGAGYRVQGTQWESTCGTSEDAGGAGPRAPGPTWRHLVAWGHASGVRLSGDALHTQPP